MVCTFEKRFYHIISHIGGTHIGGAGTCIRMKVPRRLYPALLFKYQIFLLTLKSIINKAIFIKHKLHIILAFYTSL